MDESGENQPSGGGCGSLCMTGYHGDCVNLQFMVTFQRIQLVNKTIVN